MSNLMWIGAIVAAFVVLLPQVPPEGGTPATAELPFSLGSGPAPVVYPLAFAILAILIVALAAAHTQHIRADKLAHSVIDTMNRILLVDGIELLPRDLFDMLRQPSLTRVAPLAQWVRGRWQFEGETTPCPLWRRVMSIGLYVVLKVVVLLVLFAAPGVALFVGYGQVRASGIGQSWIGLLAAVGLIAGGSLVLVTVADIWGMLPRIRKLAAAKPPPAA